LPGSSKITSIVQLSNGNLAISSENDEISIWSLTDSIKLANVTDELSSYECLAPLPNDLLASFSNEKINIWKITNKMELVKTLLGHQENIKYITALSNNFLATASDSHLKIWNVTIESTIKSEDFISSIYRITALQNGDLAVALQTSKIVVYSATNNYQPKFTIDTTSDVYFLDKLQNGNILAYDSSGSFKVYDKNTGSVLSSKNPNFILSVYRIACLQNDKVAMNVYSSNLEILGTLNLN